jgi:hypothetical protein
MILTREQAQAIADSIGAISDTFYYSDGWCLSLKTEAGGEGNGTAPSKPWRDI